MGTTNISIIIATRHRESILWQTVEKACQSISNNAEIIIVNDGDTPLTVPGFFADKISCFNNPKKGVAAARNFAVSKAKAGILFFIDDDMWINADAINWILANMAKEAKDDAVYNINWEYPTSLNKELATTKIGQYLLQSKYNTMWGRMHAPGNQPVKGLYKFNAAASGSLVMSKKTFELIGGYDESMIFQGEDISLSNKLNALSIPVYVVFDISLRHNQQDRLTIDAYLKRNADGFDSEFKAVKAGRIKALGGIHYNGIKKIMLELFRYTEKAWLLLLKLSPSNKMCRRFNNRLIGALTGLQRYKQWKKNME